MVKEQQTPRSRFPGLTSGAYACHRFAIHKIAHLQNWRCGFVVPVANLMDPHRTASV